MSIAATPGSNIPVKGGQIIIAQGTLPSSLIILHKGTVSVNSTHGDLQKKRLFAVQGPAVVGGDSLTTGRGYAYEVIAASDCVISVYPSNKDHLLNIIKSKPNIGIILLRSAYKGVLELYNKLSSCSDIIRNLMRASDSLSLGYSAVAKEKFGDDAKKKSKAALGAIDPVMPRAKVILEEFHDKGGSVPEILSEQFMLSDHSALLGHSYEPNNVLDRDDLAYVKHFVELAPQILSAIATQDPTLFFMTTKRMAKMQQALQVEVEQAFGKTFALFNNLLFDQYSWFEKIVMEVELQTQSLSTASATNLYFLTKFFLNVAHMNCDRANKVWGIKVAALPKPEAAVKLEKFTANAPKEAVPVEKAPKEKAASSGIGSAAVLKEFNGSAKKIFQWAEVPSEKFVEYQKSINAFKKLKNPLDHDGDARKIRRVLNTLFWEVYEAAALKYLRQNSSIPKIIRLFFNFGYLEETLLEEEQILFIYQKTEDEDVPYPIHYAIDWLKLIWEGKIPTSVNELGLTFFEVLRHENRRNNWKRESDLPKDVNSPEARVKYEIHNILKNTAKLTSGSIMNHFAILSKYQITQNITRSVVTKRTMSDAIASLLKIDFSAFHREILFDPPKEINIKREFIQRQVIPNVLLVPSAGTVFQFWQDREGKNKTSPGRIIAPTLNMADLFTMLLQATGALRWETVKTTMGVDWNNISNSSLTADYTDYVQFFRKNRDLSPEVKEKLSAEFKRFRDDRARFVHDYITWIKYESDGTQRHNKVARKIFAKHIPFAKDLREKLLKLPSYTDVVQKSINIRKRKAIGLEPRYRKYRSDNNGILPPELEETYRFYNMEY